MVFIQLPSSKKVLVVGQEEVALEVLEVLVEAQGLEALEVPEVLAEAQELEALEVPEVLAEAEEEVAVLEVIRNNYFKAWFNYLNLKCKSVHH